MPAAARWVRRALAADAALLAVALLAQVFTAGMAVFANPGWWAYHRAFVHWFEWLVPLALVLALAGRAPRRVTALAATAVALLALQYTTAHLRLIPGAQAWAAVHPVTAALLFWTATELARRGRRLAADRPASWSPGHAVRGAGAGDVTPAPPDCGRPLRLQRCPLPPNAQVKLTGGAGEPEPRRDGAEGRRGLSPRTRAASTPR